MKYFLLFLLALPAQAQIDSTGIFKTVRNFSDANKTELFVLFTTASLAASGCVNAAFYNPDWNGPDVHTCQEMETYATLMLGYVYGLDPVESVGLGLFAGFFFSGVIRLAVRGKFIKLDEDCSYDSFGWERRKLFCGKTRWLELGLGAGLLNYKKIIKIL